MGNATLETLQGLLALRTAKCHRPPSLTRRSDIAQFDAKSLEKGFQQRLSSFVQMCESTRSDRFAVGQTTSTEIHKSPKTRDNTCRTFIKNLPNIFMVNNRFVVAKSFCRKYLLTSLFSRVKMMEHNELQFAIPAKKIITFIVPMSGRTRVLNNYTRLMKVHTIPVL